jgi:amino acid adenylation domain-containing protein
MNSLDRAGQHTLVDLVHWRASQQPDRRAFTFLTDGEAAEVTLTYGELDRRARSLAALLQSQEATGERVLLLYPPGLEYIAALFGCWYAGAVAVPSYPPRLNRPDPRLQAIATDAQATVVLTTTPIFSSVEQRFAHTPELAALRWLATDNLTDDRVDEWRDPEVASAALALLQYTSGSTATPKGVMVSHGNLMGNLETIQRCFETHAGSRGVFWLPFYHDMGLVGGILETLYCGGESTLLSPVDFLQRPIRWLQAVSRTGASISGGPNFAYDLCVQKVTPEQRETLDLSSWGLAFNGAEPVRRETLERFAAAFAPCGFRREAFYPCYGLAEATLIVSGGAKAQPPVVRTFDRAALAANRAVAVGDGSSEGQALVGCGQAPAGQQIAIVDPELLMPCPPGRVGEIWVSSGSVAQGYWNRPAETARTFGARLADSGAGPFLRTGDLGFLQDGELFVTGRLKDLIIIRGRNVYPQDVEQTVERSHAALEAGSGAAFSVDVEGEERLVVVQELKRTQRDAGVEEVVQAIRQAVAAEHELQVYAVVLLRPMSIPKTSSGKIQRHLCRAQFLAGDLKVIGSSTLDTTLPASAEEGPGGDSDVREALQAMGDSESRQSLLTSFLRERVAHVLHLSPSQIDVDQPVSALGLDSLMAVELQHKVETRLGVVLSMMDFLQGLSVSELAAQALADLSAPSSTLPAFHVPAQEPTEEAPLSYGQRALWFLQRLSPQSAAYNIAHAARVRASLDIPALQRALQKLVERHPSLRTTFPVSRGEPVQHIHDQAEVCFQVENVLGWGEEALNERLAREASRPFDLEQGPLMRVYLFSRSDRDHVLLLVIHHSVADFWSLAVIVRELGTLYAAEVAGTPITLAPLAPQYADYTRWQNVMLAGAEGERLWTYWRRQLGGELPVLNLPTDHPRPAVQTDHGAAQALKLSAELTRGLKALSRSHGATLYVTLLAAFQTLLHRYTGQEDILVGSPTAGRGWADLAGLVGYFVNPLVLRADASGDPSFVTFLGRVRETVLEALTHQGYPFELLVERLRPDRDLSRSPLFQVMFTLQQSPWPEMAHLPAFALGEAGARIEMAGLALESVALEQRAAQFDLSLVVAETEGGLGISLQYNRDLFEAATIERMLEHLTILLEGIVAQPERRLSALALLTASEQQLLQTWNDTCADYPKDTCLHQLIEAQVQRTPNAVALVFDDRRLTYRELNEQANQLAHHLQALGVGPEAVVGLCVERAPEMLVGLLGILKAGGAYLPLDPTYPGERLAFILEDARAAVLLTQERLRERLPAHHSRVVCLDAIGEAITGESKADPHSPVCADNLAYTIYTSGSTGKPKGVPIVHRAVVNFMHAMRREPGLTERDTLLAVTTLSFDIAGLELFLPLAVGATVVLVSPDVAADGARLAARLADSGATAMQATPVTWRLLLETGWAGCHHLKALCGGEAFPRELANRLVTQVKEVWNMYGPTETTIWSATCRVGIADGPPPLGWPIANTQMYVVDRHLNLTPVGVPGELLIGGAGLARGYFNRRALTAERFIPDPFSAELGARLYRTGDLARWRPDGSLEFLGRVDHQVKVRGFRIELPEIETVLGQHAAVRQAVVLAREDTPGDKRLVAYVVPHQQPAPTVGELRQFLKGKLPEYMVPSHFLMLDALPLTPNGKIDRRALPAPEGIRPDLEAQYVAPRSELEQAIAQIWREALRVENVGIRDNFFELGGHSVLMAQIHSRLQEQGWGRDLSLVELFQYPTVHSLARYLSQAQGRLSASLSPVRESNVPGSERAEIAVIGMACRFPGAGGLEAFWQNLRDGVEAITFFSDEELTASGVDPAIWRQPNYVRASGVLSDIETFDAFFFGFSPGEAEILDPQHRLFLECAWQAIEDAGYTPETYRGLIGVYAGAGMNTYLHQNIYPGQAPQDAAQGYEVMVASDKDFLATRVAYKLDLKGPGVTVQTACSTSLVAIHLACQSLRNGECDVALAGGVSLRVPHKAGYLHREGMILSPDGHCRAFDANAQGTVIGNGAGVVVLKPLASAVADGDRIYAVIKGSMINNDGALKAGYTAPNPNAQATVIAQAQAAAGVAADTITYVEAHGTGTPIGDPIEITALTKAFCAGSTRKGFCAIGSVKTNIGHLDAAAGVAGFIKAVLALQHHQIPPSLNFTQPNPKIDFANSPFYVNTTLSDWETGGAPRRAGVSSFGIGGTNAHVVLEECPAVEPSGPARPWQLLLLSAKTESALDTATANLASHLKQQPELALADVAHTLQVGRRTFNYRRVLVCRDTDDAVAALDSLDPARILSTAQEATERPVAFLFTGQGAQYVDMGLELYQAEPTFREQVDRCCEILTPHLGFDLRDVLYPSLHPDAECAEEAAERLAQTAVTQPALFVIEYALARLWMEWGLRPQAMIGHSSGEYVAACLAGVFSLEDGLALVAARGHLMQQMPPGAMLSVSLTEREVQPFLDAQLSLAVLNGPSTCVVAGHTEAVETLQAQLEKRGAACRRLHTSHAFHSPMMEPIVEPFAERVRAITLNPPQIPYVSNVTGAWITAAEATDPGYWARHLHRTVRFAEGLQRLLEDPAQVLLEVGPGRTLSTLATRHPDKAPEQIVLSSVRHPQDSQSDVAFLLTTLGRLWLAGVAVDWRGFCTHERRRRVSLPTYPFERQRYWVQPQSPAAGARKTQWPLASKRPEVADWFYIPSWKRAPASPRRISGQPAPTRWLVFDDESVLGARLVERLRREGRDVTVVQIGAEFKPIADQTYTLNPGEVDHYTALLDQLRAQGKSPQTMVHLWNACPNGRTQPGFEWADAAQERGFYSLLFLAQALGNQNVADDLQLVVVSSGVQEVTGKEAAHPERATVLGPVTIIPYEYPNVDCRSVDVTLPQSEAEAESLVELLLTEVAAKSPDRMLAYRGAHRWVQTFEPIRLEQPEEAAPRLREKGVYLITGGLGGMGLVLAKHLAATVHARLVLIGRSAFPAADEWATWLADHGEDDPISRQIRQVQELEALGAEVMVVCADVAGVKPMQAAVSQARARFGRIDGVIHAAGVPGAGIIQLKKREAAERVLSPKVKGTLVLDAVLKDTPLDFLVLCSSINSVVGRAGQVDYCAANAFLDAYVQHKNAAGGTPTLCINWDTWREVGMAVKAAESSAGVPQMEVAHPLLDRCIARSDTQAIYATDLSVRQHWVLHEHGIMGKATIPGTTYLEMAVAAFGQQTGNGAVEIRDAFFVTPLIVEGEGKREARIVLTRQGEAYRFLVASSLGDDLWQEHAKGALRSIPAEAPKKYNLAEIEARCNAGEVVDPLGKPKLGCFDLRRQTVTVGAAGDEPFSIDVLSVTENSSGQTRSMEFGPRWHTLKRVRLGANEGLALLELPQELSADVQPYRLHPALLDFATSFLRLFKSQGSYLPLSYKRLRVMGPLPAKIYSYARFIDDDPGQGATQRFDVTIMDEQGTVLVEIEEFAVIKVEDADRVGAVARPRPASAIFGAGTSGLREGANPYADVLEQDLQEGLWSAEGVDVFSRVMGSTLPRVVVSARDLPARLEQAWARRAALTSGMEDTAAPRPKHPRPDLMNAYVAPGNEVEQKLTEIWQDVLGIEQVGIRDNFYDLGGDSLLITQVHSRFRRAFDADVSVASLLQYPTIADLAQFLSERGKGEEAPPVLEQVQSDASKQKEMMKRRKEKMMQRSMIKDPL